METKSVKTTDVMAVTAKGHKYVGSEKSTHNTAATWELTKKFLANGKRTRGELFSYLQKERNHACFVTYALSRGWIAVK